MMRRLFLFIFLIFNNFITIVVTIITSNDINRIIESNEELKPVTEDSCFNESFHAENIHIVTITIPASYRLQHQQQFQINRQTMEFYSALHGYQFSIVNPIPILKYYYPKLVSSKLSLRFITTMKSLIMLYQFRYLRQKFGCKIKMLLFLDVDVMVTDFTQSLESIINYADEMMIQSSSPSAAAAAAAAAAIRTASIETKKNQCDVIVQLSSNTLNTGILFFRLTKNSDNLLSRWVDITIHQENQQIEWQHDQGRFQSLYLEHLLNHSSSSLINEIPLNCNSKFYDQQSQYPIKSLFKGLSVDHIRNLCFMKNLYLLGFLPTKNNVNLFKEKQNKKINSYKSNYYSFFNQFCILPILKIKQNNLTKKQENIFNLHDFHGKHLIINQNYVFIPNSISTSSVLPHEDVSLRDELEDKTGLSHECSIDHPIFYHGKDFYFHSLLIKLWQYLQKKYLLKKEKEIKFNENILGFSIHDILYKHQPYFISTLKNKKLNITMILKTKQEQLQELNNIQNERKCFHQFILILQSEAKRDEWMHENWKRIIRNIEIQ